MPSSPEPTISHSDDLDFFKDFENKFPDITYNDDLTSKLTEPSILWVDEGMMQTLAYRDDLEAVFFGVGFTHDSEMAEVGFGGYCRHLAAHFGLVGDEDLRGLLVITHELSMIDLHELVRLNICMLTVFHAAPPPVQAALTPRLLGLYPERLLQIHRIGSRRSDWQLQFSNVGSLIDYKVTIQNLCMEGKKVKCCEEAEKEERCNTTYPGLGYGVLTTGPAVKIIDDMVYL
ncbi:hypothetical protein Tco_0278375 [Tanacetum coccineum]